MRRQSVVSIAVGVVAAAAAGLYWWQVQRARALPAYIVKSAFQILRSNDLIWSRPIHEYLLVSEPGHAGRTYRIRTREPGERYLDPQSWQAETMVHQGSWWPEWESWLARHSTARVPPPSMAAAAKGYPARQEAPGSYVREA